MDAEASPSRSVAHHLRVALGVCSGAWRHTARLALDIALPTLCVACREPVSGEGVCATCWAKLSFIAPPYCPRLGIPFVYDPGPDLLSMEAIVNPPAYARARAAVRYDDVARTLVHALKYQDRTDLAPAMGRWMARAGREILREADALIPVPLHWRRGWSAAVTVFQVRPVFIDVAVGANRFFHNPLGLAGPQITPPNRLVFGPCWSYSAGSART
jgi:hypothetical protein